MYSFVPRSLDDLKSGVADQTQHVLTPKGRRSASGGMKAVSSAVEGIYFLI